MQTPFRNTHSFTGPLDRRRVVSRYALQSPDVARSLAMSQAASAVSPTSTSNWRIEVCRWRPCGRFHSGLTSGRWPARVLTARRSASCAGTDPCRRRHNVWILINACHGFCCRCFVAESGSLPTRLAQSRTSVFQESVVSTTWWRDSSFCSSDFVRVQVSASYVTVGRRRQGRCRPTIAAWCTDLVLIAAIHLSADPWHRWHVANHIGPIRSS